MVPTVRIPFLVLLVVFASACDDPTPVSMPVAIGDAPMRGPVDAWVTVVEFADFQCPYCGLAEPRVTELLAMYPDDVRLVYKHFPLPQHANARPAANAAECARAQGVAPDGYFWEMHDLLFAHGSALDAASLATYAGQVAGLDTTAWQTCFDALAYDGRVQADLDQGRTLGVNGTPTFVINGKPIVGAASVETLAAAVESARAAAIASGIPAADYYDRAILGL